ncbi:MAG TPA: nuclear transport factor 2 family protein [Thermoanaerobaculia bacterium]|jgi:hypothetical protein
MKPLFVLLPIVALTFACTTQQQLQHPNDPESQRVAEIIKAEERLTSALAQGRSAVVNDILAEDFRCAVADHPWFRFDREPARSIACTGFGHDRTQEALRAEWIYAYQSTAPRVATIDDVAVKLNERGATVVSLQSYSNWLPYSGPTARRSRVIDKWIHAGDEWKLVSRFSEPLAANAVATLLPSR